MGAELQVPAKRPTFWRWLTRNAGIVGVVVAVITLVSTVRWLGKTEPNQPEGSNVSLEAQWDAAIRRLGIEPVYPPQEDLTAGDLFATVVAVNPNYKPDPHTVTFGQKPISSSTPFLGKSVKIGHVPVGGLLDQAYAGMPLFPETGAQ